MPSRIAYLNSGYQDWTDGVLPAYLKYFYQITVEISIFKEICNFFLVGGNNMICVKIDLILPSWTSCL